MTLGESLEMLATATESYEGLVAEIAKLSRRLAGAKCAMEVQHSRTTAMAMACGYNSADEALAAYNAATK